MTDEKKPRGNPGWKKGQSGNPGGRAKGVRDVIAAARTHTAEAIETLVKWMRSDEARASVAAATVMLDRGWGKAAQSLKISGSLTNQHAAELTEAELELIARGGSDGTAGEGEGTTQPSNVH